MTEPTRQISPDGAYWWDGQAWRPMPSTSIAAAMEQPQPEAARPSWLPEATVLPGQLSPSTPSAGTDSTNAPSANAYSEPAPSPQWIAPQPSRASRSPIILGAAVALALVVAGRGAYAFHTPRPHSRVHAGPAPV